MKKKYLVKIIIFTIFLNMFLFYKNYCFADVNLDDSSFNVKLYDEQDVANIIPGINLEYNEQRKWYEHEYNGKKYVALIRSYRRRIECWELLKIRRYILF